MKAVKDSGNDRDRVLIRLVNQYQRLLRNLCYIYLRDVEWAKEKLSFS